MKTLFTTFLCILIMSCGSTSPQSPSQEKGPSIDINHFPHMTLPKHQTTSKQDQMDVDFCLKGASSREEMLKDPNFIALTIQLVKSGKSDEAKAIIAAISSNSIICKNSQNAKGSAR